MAEYATCTRCGKMFMRVSSPICVDCDREEEEAFNRLKAYLSEYPGNSMAVVSKETGVPMKRILRYLRDGRLEITTGMAADSPLNCGRCGKPIKLGTLCDECRTQYNMAVNQLKHDSIREKQEGTGMHSAPSGRNDSKRK